MVVHLVSCLRYVLPNQLGAALRRYPDLPVYEKGRPFPYEQAFLEEMLETCSKIAAVGLTGSSQPVLPFSRCKFPLLSSTQRLVSSLLIRKIYQLHSRQCAMKQLMASLSQKQCTKQAQYVNLAPNRLIRWQIDSKRVKSAQVKKVLYLRYPLRTRGVSVSCLCSLVRSFVCDGSDSFHAGFDTVERGTAEDSPRERRSLSPVRVTRPSPSSEAEDQEDEEEAHPTKSVSGSLDISKSG